jgi:hypothetical protein
MPFQRAKLESLCGPRSSPKLATMNDQEARKFLRLIYLLPNVVTESDIH